MVFKQPLVSNLKPHSFHLDSSLKRSSNIPNLESRIPTQCSLVNSELLFFITIQYPINWARRMKTDPSSSDAWTDASSRFIIGTQTDVPNWLPENHRICQVTVDIVSRTGSEQDYSAKTDFETRRENQDFGRQNNYMSRPPFDPTPLGTNMTNGTTSPIDSIPVEKNSRDYSTDTTNGIDRAKRKNTRTRGTGYRLIVYWIVMKNKSSELARLD